MIFIVYLSLLICWFDGNLTKLQRFLHSLRSHRSSDKSLPLSSKYWLIQIPKLGFRWFTHIFHRHFAAHVFCIPLSLSSGFYVACKCNLSDFPLPRAENCWIFVRPRDNLMPSGVFTLVMRTPSSPIAEKEKKLFFSPLSSHYFQLGRRNSTEKDGGEGRISLPFKERIKRGAKMREFSCFENCVGGRII